MNNIQINVFLDRQAFLGLTLPPPKKDNLLESHEMKNI